MKDSKPIFNQNNLIAFIFIIAIILIGNSALNAQNASIAEKSPLQQENDAFDRYADQLPNGTRTLVYWRKLDQKTRKITRSVAFFDKNGKKTYAKIVFYKNVFETFFLEEKFKESETNSIKLP